MKSDKKKIDKVHKAIIALSKSLLVAATVDYSIQNLEALKNESNNVSAVSRWLDGIVSAIAGIIASKQL